jgi:drug/metabolite transporter (DMT)-like permease
MLKGILLVFFGACSFGILSTFVKLAYHEGYTLGDVTGAQAFFGAVILLVLFFFEWPTTGFK